MEKKNYEWPKCVCNTNEYEPRRADFDTIARAAAAFAHIARVPYGVAQDKEVTINGAVVYSHQN